MAWVEKRKEAVELLKNRLIEFYKAKNPQHFVGENSYTVELLKERADERDWSVVSNSALELILEMTDTSSNYVVQPDVDETPKFDEKLFFYLKDKFIGSRWEIKFYSNIRKLVEHPEIDGFDFEGDYDHSYIDINDTLSIEFDKKTGITNTMIDYHTQDFNVDALYDDFENDFKEHKMLNYREFYYFTMPLLMDYTFKQ